MCDWPVLGYPVRTNWLVCPEAVGGIETVFKPLVECPCVATAYYTCVMHINIHVYIKKIDQWQFKWI
jgi:hypothetical protein